MEERFSTVMQAERDRLQGEREEIFTKQRELEKKLTEINREFQAIEAYETAKSGKAMSSRRGSGGARRGAPRAARTGTRREELLQVIRGGGGLSRGDILEKMGLKGDKTGEMSVSNALTALSKSSQVRRENGKYYA